MRIAPWLCVALLAALTLSFGSVIRYLLPEDLTGDGKSDLVARDSSTSPS